MTEDLPQIPAPPGVPDIDHYTVLADQGATLVAILNFVTAAGIAAMFTATAWTPWASTPSMALLTIPGIFATILAVAVGPRLWRRLVVDGRRFAAWKGALAGGLTVVLVQTITVEVFLTVGFGFLRLLEPGSPYLAEFPALFLMAPIYSVPTVGVVTVPAGTLVGLSVAAYCQGRLVSRLRR